jgi:hypothetical protein
MAMNLPRPPDIRLYDVDNPRQYVEQLYLWLTRVVAEIERDSREQTAPARAVIDVRNVPNPTTIFDAAPPLNNEQIANFLGGLIDTMVKRGFLRTKAGQE